MGFAADQSTPAADGRAPRAHAAIAPVHRPRTRWAAVLIAIAAGVVAAFHVGKLPSSIPALRDEIGLSLVAAGWAASTFNTVGTLAALPLGVLSTRVQRLTTVAAGLVLLAAGGGIGALAQAPATLLASRAVEGAGFLAVVIGAPALILAATAPPDRNLSLGLWSTYMPVGTTLMLVASPFALPQIGWRGLWVGNAAIALALLALLVAWRAEYREQAPVAPGAAGAGDPDGGPAVATTAAAVAAAAPVAVALARATPTLARPALWLLGLAFALYTAQWITLMTWLPTYLTGSRGLAMTEAALATAFVVACNVPGNLIGTWALRREIRHGTLIAAAALAMGLCAMAIFADAAPTALRVLAYVVFSCAGGMLPAAVLSGAPHHAAVPRDVVVTSGVVMQGSNVGQFIGPPLVAAIVTGAGGNWTAAVPFLVGCAAACFGVGLLLRRSATTERHPPG